MVQIRLAGDKPADVVTKALEVSVEVFQECNHHMGIRKKNLHEYRDAQDIKAEVQVGWHLDFGTG
jgi:hypothetical protein